MKWQYDEPPKDGTEIIVALKFDYDSRGIHEIMTCWWNGKDWENNFGMHWADIEVVAWMPIVEPDQSKLRDIRSNHD